MDQNLRRCESVQGAKPIEDGKLPRIPACDGYEKLGVGGQAGSAIEIQIGRPDDDKDVIHRGMTQEYPNGAGKNGDATERGVLLGHGPARARPAAGGNNQGGGGH
jgi:hypothetical protein